MWDRIERDGGAVVEGVVPTALIDTFEAEIDALASGLCARRGVARDTQDALTDLLRSGDGFRRLLFPQLKSLPSLRNIALAVNDHVADGLREGAGFQAPSMHWLFKADVPGETKYLLPMHQDYNTPCHRAYRAWVPLRDAGERNGTIRYVPGSQAAGFIAHDTSNPELPTVTDYDRDAVRQLDLTRGDIFLFDPLLVHGSVPATGPGMKYVLIVNFWDLSSMADPDDPNDPIIARIAMGKTRDQVRGDLAPVLPRT